MADKKKDSFFEEAEEKEIKIEQPKYQKSNKKYKIVLVAPSHIVIDFEGNNRYISGVFTDKKSGDFIELAL